MLDQLPGFQNLDLIKIPKPTSTQAGEVGDREAEMEEVKEKGKRIRTCTCHICWSMELNLP